MGFTKTLAGRWLLILSDLFKKKVTTKFKKFPQNNTPTTTLICFSDDLLIKILRRLPAKSIFRFKSVSKHWLSLLSNRHFTLLFDKLSISPGFFIKNLYVPFDVENPSTPPFRSLTFCHDPHGIKIVQSCNGLLLCCSNIRSNVDCIYYVFNPTTKQYAVIPPLIGGRNVRKDIPSMALAFHHTDCPHYKLVCLNRRNPYRDYLCNIQIYSSDIRKWRISNESFHLPHWYFSNYVVYWNGALYWASTLHYPFYFKLDVEQIQNLPSPNCQEYGSLPSSFLPFYFGESRGHFHLMEKANNGQRLNMNVYEMLRDHSGWFLKYRLDLNVLVEACPCFEDRQILDIVRGEKDEDTFMVVSLRQNIVRYNILDKSIKLISDIHGIFHDEQQLYRYIETIASF